MKSTRVEIMITNRCFHWLFVIVILVISIFLYTFSNTLPVEANATMSGQLKHPNGALSCNLCHISSAGLPTANQKICLDASSASVCQLNSYGEDLQKEFNKKIATPRLASIIDSTVIKDAISDINKLDSDKDGWSNEQELSNQGNKHPGSGEAKPDVVIELTTNPSAAIVGEEVTYHVLVTNISAHTSVVPELTVDSDSVKDLLGSQCKLNGSSTITKGISTDFDCTATVTEAAIQDNKLTNVFSVTFNPPSLIKQTKSETIVLGVAEIAAKLDVVVTPNLTEVVHGEPLTYQITVTNKTSVAGSTDASLATISNLEIVKDGTPCQEAIKPIAELALNASASFQCTVQANQALDKKVNFQAKGELKINNSPFDIAPTTPIEVEIEARKPDLTLEMSHSLERLSGNDRISLTLTLRNSGNVLLSDVDIKIGRIPSCIDPFDSIAAKSAPLAYTCSVEIDPSLVEEINGEQFYSFLVTLSGTDKFDGKKPEFPPQIIDIDISNRLFLPLINSTAGTPAQNIDLIVSSIIVNEQGASVTIKNIGNTSLVGTGYWVDLYITPTHVPTQVNQLARDWGDFGLVWGIPASADELPPNGELTLKSGDPFCSPELSEAPSILQSGWEIYAQVDSANKNTNYGGVLESHEIINDHYNNIASIQLSDVVATQKWSVCQPDQASASTVKVSRGLAERPR